MLSWSSISTIFPDGISLASKNSSSLTRHQNPLCFYCAFLFYFEFLVLFFHLFFSQTEKEEIKVEAKYFKILNQFFFRFTGNLYYFGDWFFTHNFFPQGFTYHTPCSCRLRALISYQMQSAPSYNFQIMWDQGQSLAEVTGLQTWRMQPYFSILSRSIGMPLIFSSLL